jgi:hypothetical protein
MKSRRKSKVKSRISRISRIKSKVKSRKIYRKSRVKTRKSSKSRRKSRVKSRKIYKKSRFDNGWKENLWNYIKSSSSNIKNYIKNSSSNIKNYIKSSPTNIKNYLYKQYIRKLYPYYKSFQNSEYDKTTLNKIFTKFKNITDTANKNREKKSIDINIEKEIVDLIYKLPKNDRKKYMDILICINRSIRNGKCNEKYCGCIQKENEQNKKIKKIKDKKIEDKKIEDKKKDKKKDIQLRGTKNLGNTCFVNASNILLANIPNIIKNLNNLKSESSLIQTLIPVLNNIKNNNCNEDIKKFVDNLRKHTELNKKNQFGWHQQEDATEYLNAITSKIEGLRGSSFLDNFILTSELTKEGIDELELPSITSTEDTPEKRLKLQLTECEKKIGEGKPCTTQFLLDSYLKEEILKEDAWADYDNTNIKVPTKKKLYIKSILPHKRLEYIIFELLRYSVYDGLSQKNKTPITITNIELPVIIDNKIVIQKMRPKIVVVHDGNFGSGHYVAYVINNDNIICYSDDNVTIENETDINEIRGVTENAYLILYLPGYMLLL